MAKQNKSDAKTNYLTNPKTKTKKNKKMRNGDDGNWQNIGIDIGNDGSEPRQ